MIEIEKILNELNNEKLIKEIKELLENISSYSKEDRITILKKINEELEKNKNE